MIYIYRNDPNIDPDAVENTATLHAREVFAELKDEKLRGVTRSRMICFPISFCIEFISRGRFLREEISLLRLFALAMLKGDAPPGSDDDDGDDDD